MKRVAIFGATAVEVLDLLQDCISAGSDWEIIGYFDDNSSLIGQMVEGLPVLGTSADLSQSVWSDVFLVNNVAATARVRQIVHNKLYSIVGDRLLTVVHPTCRVSTRDVGIGTVIQSGSTISRGAKIGVGCLINFNCIVAHGTSLGDACVLAPASTINGLCRLGDRVFVGAGAVIAPRAVVGADAIVGIGSVVIGQVKSGTTVFGCPARRLPQLKLTEAK